MSPEFNKAKAREICDNLRLGNDQQMSNAAKMLPAAIERIQELEENNRYLLEMEASYVAENEVLREQIDSWIADRDRWLARYEATQKEIAALQERIEKLQEALIEAQTTIFIQDDDRAEVPRFAGQWATCECTDYYRDLARGDLHKRGLLP